MGPKNSACKSGLAVKSGVVKSDEIIIVKAYKRFGSRQHGCIRNAVKSGDNKAVVHCICNIFSA